MPASRACVAPTDLLILLLLGAVWGVIALGEPVGAGVVGGFVLVLAGLVPVLGVRVPVPGAARRALLPRPVGVRPSAAG